MFRHSQTPLLRFIVVIVIVIVDVKKKKRHVNKLYLVALNSKKPYCFVFNTRWNIPKPWDGAFCKLVIMVIVDHIT